MLSLLSSSALVIGWVAQNRDACASRVFALSADRHAILFQYSPADLFNNGLG